MKGKFSLFSAIANIAIIISVAAVAAAGFFPSVQSTSNEQENVYYSSPASRGISLMFNVYQNTQEVQKILDILDGGETGGGAKATFFVGGCWADDNVDCVREIKRRGHEIASHGYFHKDHSALDYAKNHEEIEMSVRLLKALTGESIKLFAPPSGAYCEATVKAARDLNLKTIMWSRDTIDWRDEDEKVIIKRATQGLKAGEFVLMHPTPQTVKALPKIIEIAGGIAKLITVSDNIGE